ncbi:glycosyltransferase [Wenzhouxiangella sp. XN79A]|uniref:glycosyltransferase family 2 protein n=1 Tax=Wenzhouxiangella sp. XN79A TaxID=2724193 RepID=UPI00144AD414|nr:glycosyltransferase family 2 protein [Wenzhouxiangella sp. XN79A]NKI36429.1 glycosyltransferase [Wenzhouxiangella sp. XN79A]
MNTDLPRISVVTPNYNQAPFLEQTLASVLDQGYPNLDYIVMDGGSNDGSLQIVERYADRLAHWESAEDKGQYDAVTRGFAHATGDVMGWINSDDIYLPWTLRTVGEIFRDCPQVAWITSLTQPQIGETEMWTGVFTLPGVSRESFLDGRHLGFGYRNTGYIQQESTFWRRSLWEKAGAAVGQTCGTAGDFELWCAFFMQSEVCCVAQPLAAFRSRLGQRSQTLAARYEAESVTALAGCRARMGHRSRLGARTADLVSYFLRRKPAFLVGGLGYISWNCVSEQRGWKCYEAAFL